MEKERILLVEDHPVNRALIVKLLSDTYEVVEMENGQAALDFLAANYRTVSGIVLDLEMPVMDGLEFLKHYSRIPAYANLPVLVTAASQDADKETECLKLGVWDFIRKPIDPALLKLRLKNIIGRSQNVLSRQIRHMAEHDELTELYNRKYFLAATRRLLDETAPKQAYVLLHVDIKRFRLVNSFFGTATGDALLRFLSERLCEQFEPIPRCTLGRMEADVFCACASLSDEEIETMATQMQSQLDNYKENYYLELSFGVYRIENRELPLWRRCVTVRRRPQS